MLTQENTKMLQPFTYHEVERRRQFIERMERKLAHKTALHRRRRQQFRERLMSVRSWH